MSHTFLTFCRRRGRTSGIRFHQDDGDRVDRSPRDRQSSTCAKSIISGSDRRAYQLPCGDTWSVRSPSEQTIAIDGLLGDSWGWSDLHRMDHNLHRSDGWWLSQKFPRRSSGGSPSSGGPSSRSWHTGSSDRDRPLTWSSIGRRERFAEELHDRGPIELWSSCDCGTLAEIMAHNHVEVIVQRSWPSIPPHDRIKRLEILGQNSF